ncbi:CD276 antigen-like isoform X1 [Chiloscyllium plagiosum]|uniref:CD276 antigen-like isoform X1 n=1 Tax=Chiloscyllium plagiosum TaxID=36176 RepID=UPI001CB81853|nr:CD276 antigen-like isoform X1 [Chiloscyllium plagiosum]
MYNAILSVCLVMYLLLGSCRGVFKIQVPEVPVVAIFGKDITLNCSFTTNATFSLGDLSVIWQLTETRKMVHKYPHQPDQQADNFVNRTALFTEELEKGNASLLLRHVRIEDEGSFTCFVRIKSHQSASIMLRLAASYSKPSLHLEPNKNLKPGDEVAIACHSSGGYPQATVQWHDGKGSNITENVTTSQVANEEGLFDVRSVIRVILEPNSTYSCLVRNELLNEETQALATITGQHLKFPVVALWLTIGLSICLLGLLAALGYVCRRKIRQSCEENKAEDDAEEETEARTVMKPLEHANDKEELCLSAVGFLMSSLPSKMFGIREPFSKDARP